MRVEDGKARVEPIGGEECADERGRAVALRLSRRLAVAGCSVALAVLVAVGILASTSGGVSYGEMSEDGMRGAVAGAFDEALRKTPLPEAFPDPATVVPDDSGEGEGGGRPAGAEVAGEGTTAASANQDGGVAPLRPSGETTPALSQGGGDAPSGGSGAPAPSHRHAWVPEKATVDHPAEYKDVPHGAVYDDVAYTACNACPGEDISGRVVEHMKGHAFAGESASYYTAYKRVCVEDAWIERDVLVGEAWSEEVPTGFEVCPCGARR